MNDLTIDKIRSMWQAHNDGVYRLEARENLGEIVGFLLRQNDRLRQAIDCQPRAFLCSTRDAS